MALHESRFSGVLIEFRCNGPADRLNGLGTVGNFLRPLCLLVLGGQDLTKGELGNSRDSVLPLERLKGLGIVETFRPSLDETELGDPYLNDGGGIRDARALEDTRGDVFNVLERLWCRFLA